ncbi:MAG: GGDEF domain-containing protein [Gammaproteobacteria bacterium]|nr:MAG: GGDEF domain-containing protein [Gammaproteobacteria bacterium]
MYYQESREQSAEILRLAVERMGRQPAPYHPLTYTVWYEYLAGINPRLRQAVDALCERGEPVDGAAVQELYDAHVARLAEHREVREALHRLVREVQQAMQEAGSETERYQRALERAGRHLDGALEEGAAGRLDPAALRGLVEGLLEDTTTMSRSVQVLASRLEEREREVALLREQLETARRQSETDPLTGLANRRAFDAAVAEAVARREGGEMAALSVVALDIDRFKGINDSYGHLFGDRVIAALAQVLRQRTKGRDLPARIGGEEMAVLLPDTPLEGAAALGEEIRAAFERARVRRVDTGEVVGRITVSVGVAEYLPGEGVQRWLDRADRALYASKQGGRNRVSVFRASPEEAPAL